MDISEPIQVKLEPGVDTESHDFLGVQTVAENIAVKIEDDSSHQNNFSLDIVKKECTDEPSNHTDDTEKACEVLSDDVDVKADVKTAVNHKEDGQASPDDVELKSEVKVVAKPEAENTDAKPCDVEGDADVSDEEFMEVSSGEEGFEEEEEEEEEEATMAASARAHGFTSQTLSVTIDLPPQNMEIEETVDNTDVLRSVLDLCKLLQAKYIPMTQKWLEVSGRSGMVSKFIQI